MAIMSEFSSGLIALHEACYAISMGMATSAIVACAEPPLLTASVEQDAISVLYLKPLHAARRDGNLVRAVIRAAETDYYSSFHEAELPAERMYENLIRRAYEKAGLDPGHTITVQVSATFFFSYPSPHFHGSLISYSKLLRHPLQLLSPKRSHCKVYLASSVSPLTSKRISRPLVLAWPACSRPLTG